MPYVGNIDEIFHGNNELYAPHQWTMSSNGFYAVFQYNKNVIIFEILYISA